VKWYRVTVDDIQKPFIKKIVAGSKSICVVGYEGKVYALGSKCPHAGADLINGWCNNGKLVCPFHRYSYDLATGRGSPGQNDYIDSYPVKISEQTVYIGVSSFWERLKIMFK
jgi:nitrite reductase/ring-hydroxylating ferredoxin subunit